MTEPEVSVVVATHDRRDRLAALLDSLRAQSVDGFEVVVVDDGSGDGTEALLEDAGRRGDLALTVIRRDTAGGSGDARDAGWRAARGKLVAFTDDDCVADVRWLEHLLSAAREDHAAVLQGSTEAIPSEAHLLSPFSRTMIVREPGPPWQTCNLAFPRAVLEAIDGFDRSLDRTGEDTDLAWRAIEIGATVRWLPEARVYHAVLPEGPLGMLRYAWRWRGSVRMYARHPELRRRKMHHGIFWSPVHEHLLLAMLALVLPRRLWLLKVVLAAPYAKRLAWRRSGPVFAPYFVVHDLVELAGMIQGSARARVLVL